MDVRVLGPLEVRLGDGPISLGPRKQRAVLAMLALEPGRAVSADRLAEGLWGDPLPPSAAKMVQLYVSHLRRALDGDAVRIVTRGRGYALQLAEGEVDAVRAERLARRGAAARGAGAVAGLAARGPRRRAVRGIRDPQARGAPPARGRAGDRRRPRRRPPRRGDRRARRARRGEPAARAPARPADARALSRRPAVGGARCLSRGACGARGGDRRRARRRLAAPARADPRARPGARPARARRGGATHATAATLARSAGRRRGAGAGRRPGVRHHPRARA